MTRDLLLFACGLSFAACWDWDHLVGGADASDAAPTSFCAQVDARFCDDFDDSDGATFDHWSSSNFAHAATMSRAPSDASTPFAARFDSYGVDGGIPEAFLKTFFTDAVTSFVTFSFDMRVDQFPTIPTASFTAAGFALASDNGGAILLVEQDSTTLAATIPTDGGTSYTTIPLAFVAQPGVWAHFDVTFTKSAGTISVAAAVDQKQVLVATALDPRISMGLPSISIGEVYTASNTDRTSFLVDDVVVRFE
jgi:hypothetical protein